MGSNVSRETYGGNNDFDVIVIGGGHAGIEASSATARMGMQTALITMDPEKIGLMSCNPAIGGLAKGQLVREIDALGGEMGRIIDATGIHFKMLNTSKGPAVWSPRAQADRKQYAVTAGERLLRLKNMVIIKGQVNRLIIEHDTIRGVGLENDDEITASIVIVTAGTFLNGIIHIGLSHVHSGRAGEKPAAGITESLVEHGFESDRLKTGTPPRLHRDSIDFSRFEIQKPDNPPQPFSFATRVIEQTQINCHIGYTNNKTHRVLREGFDESPMFSGRIKSIGPRYCPSIEDKINRFSERPRHQLFLEPEGYNDPEIYLNGFSTSLPERTQVKAIHTIAGLERAEILRLGYAVEYDFFPPHQLHFTLETKKVKNLYLAGQICGTSGYEEAAAQGLIAGINGALKLNREPSFQLDRSQAYIGVLIDDLINKSTHEPYRMFTSRAEFRLQLRQDNADLRLAGFGYRFGLLEKAMQELVVTKKRDVRDLIDFLKSQKIDPDLFNKNYVHKSAPIRQPVPLTNVLRRPEVHLRELLDIVGLRSFAAAAVHEVEFNVKYEGYISRNRDLVERFKQYEAKKIPVDFHYNKIKALSAEAIEKLEKIKPGNLGQAARISGVTPADLSILMVHLEKRRQAGSKVSRETSSVS